MAFKVKKTAEAAPAVKFISFSIGGEEYQLAFSFNGLVRAEKETGEDLLRGMASLLVGAMNATQWRGLLYGALLKAHPKITPDEAGNLMQQVFIEETPAELLEALRAAYQASFSRPVPIQAAPPAETSAGSSGS